MHLKFLAINKLCKVIIHRKQYKLMCLASYGMTNKYAHASISQFNYVVISLSYVAT